MPGLSFGVSRTFLVDVDIHILFPNSSNPRAVTLSGTGSSPDGAEFLGVVLRPTGQSSAPLDRGPGSQSGLRHSVVPVAPHRPAESPWREPYSAPGEQERGPELLRPSPLAEFLRDPVVSLKEAIHLFEASFVGHFGLRG